MPGLFLLALRVFASDDGFALCAKVKRIPFGNDGQRGKNKKRILRFAQDDEPVIDEPADDKSVVDIETDG